MEHTSSINIYALLDKSELNYFCNNVHKKAYLLVVNDLKYFVPMYLLPLWVKFS